MALEMMVAVVELSPAGLDMIVSDYIYRWWHYTEQAPTSSNLSFREVEVTPSVQSEAVQTLLQRELLNARTQCTLDSEVSS